MEGQFDLGREVLKWIALTTMTIDHVGAILYPEQTVLRLIGRLSFPLYCYLIVLGVESTRNVRSYFIRLFIFALVSQVPFYLALGVGPFESFNIFFTLSFGVLFIFFLKKKSLLVFLPLLASSLNFDYSIYGILLIGSMYILRGDEKSGAASIVLLNLLFLPMWPAQIFSLLSLPIILLYNSGSLKIHREPKGKTAYPFWRKYFFYLYYPLHLTLLYIVKLNYFPS
jgi:hypothetical protein